MTMRSQSREISPVENIGFELVMSIVDFKKRLKAPFIFCFVLNVVKFWALVSIWFISAYLFGQRRKFEKVNLRYVYLFNLETNKINESHFIKA